MAFALLRSTPSAQHRRPLGPPELLRGVSSPLSRPRGVPPCTRLPVRPAAAGRPGRGHGSAPVSDAAVNPGRARLSKSAFSFSRREQAEVEWRAPRRSRRGRADPAAAAPIPGPTRSHEAPRQPSRAAREVSSACCRPTAASPRRLAARRDRPGDPSRSDLRTWLAPCTFGCARVTSSL